jgi:N-acetyl-alpha-D-muramate 1-phosphate uridylyltransferase
LPKVMQIAILAGGLATRLGKLTQKKPKSLLEIQGKPFIEYQIEQVKKQGIIDIVLCTGYLGERIEHYLGNGTRHGVNIRYSHEDKPLGTAGALKKASNLLEGEFLAMYGDSYLFLDFAMMFSYFLARKKTALMTVYKNHDRHDRSNTSVSGGLVTGYSKNGRTADMVYIDYGAQAFSQAALELVPAERYFPLEDLFPALIARRQLLAFEVRDRFYEIGSMQGIRDFREYIRGNQ